MDELVNALIQMNEHINSYRINLSENMDETLRIINDTKNNLGDDTLGERTIDILKPVLKSLRATYDIVDEIYRAIDKKKDELLSVRSEYCDESDDSGNSQYSYGQKDLHKELLNSSAIKRR